MAAAASALALLAMAAAPARASSDQAMMANPWQPQAEFAVTTAAGGFVLVVAPNLVEHARARASALAKAARYCQSIGKSAPAEFDYVKRYSDYVLDGWEFGGACE